MRLRIYVHDLHLEIGHSRATIDILNHLTQAQKSAIQSIEVIAFTSTSVDKLFPWSRTKKKFIQVPFPKLKPFILKSVFYQLWTMIYHLTHANQDVINVSVGIAFPFSDIVNVQFIHHHWNEIHTIYEKAPWYKKIYKKVLFAYFDFCESLIYRPGKRQFLVLSEFTKIYLENRFKLLPNQAHLTYSSVNVENFNVLSLSKPEIVDKLKSESPSLSRLDLTRPIYLFVGGYERKGLPWAMEVLAKKGNAQFIIIGKPENKSQKLEIPAGMDVHLVNFTRQLNLYYNLSDVFIFPTSYEPFGLVILEAAFAGLSILVPRNNVGASELLVNDQWTSFMDAPGFELPEAKIMTTEERQHIVAERRRSLSKIRWEDSSEILYQNVLAKYVPAAGGN